MTQTPKISRRSQVTRGKTSIIIANVLLALIFLMPLYWTFISSYYNKVVSTLTFGRGKTIWKGKERSD